TTRCPGASTTPRRSVGRTSCGSMSRGRRRLHPAHCASGLESPPAGEICPETAILGPGGSENPQDFRGRLWDMSTAGSLHSRGVARFVPWQGNNFALSRSDRATRRWCEWRPGRAATTARSGASACRVAPDRGGGPRGPGRHPGRRPDRASAGRRSRRLADGSDPRCIAPDAPPPPRPAAPLEFVYRRIAEVGEPRHCVRPVCSPAAIPSKHGRGPYLRLACALQRGDKRDGAASKLVLVISLLGGSLKWLRSISASLR